MIVAFAIRNQIDPNWLVGRIVAVGLCVSVVYLPAMHLLRLPGWEVTSPRRLRSWLGTTLKGLKKIGQAIPKLSAQHWVFRPSLAWVPLCGRIDQFPPDFQGCRDQHTEILVLAAVIRDSNSESASLP